MYQSGLSAEAIALKRKLGVPTIISHLAKLYIDGHAIDLSEFVSDDEVSKIAAAQIKLESPNTLKPYFDYFEETISYDKLRIGLAIIEKETNQTKAI